MLGTSRHGAGIAEVVALEAADRRLGKARAHIRILTGAFDDTSPTGIAGKVDHRRERPMNALRRGLIGDGAVALGHKLGIERASACKRNRENGMMTVNDVASEDHGDAETALLHGDMLKAVIMLHIDLGLFAVTRRGAVCQNE